MSRAGRREEWLNQVAVKARDLVTDLHEAGIRHDTLETLSELLDCKPTSDRPPPESWRRESAPKGWTKAVPRRPGIYWVGYKRSGGFWAAEPTPVEVLGVDLDDDPDIAVIGSEAVYGLDDFAAELWWSPRLVPYEVGE